MELLIILFLIPLNGFFSMTEIAVVASKRVKLEGASRGGKKKAAAALELVLSPDRFFSTVQIGITLIGLLTGIYSGENITNDVEAYLSQFEAVSHIADGLAVIIVLVIITFCSLILGELVPKQIGFANPEAIAIVVAPFMKIISRITYPFVWILTQVSGFILRIFHIEPSEGNKVTEEEIKAIIRAGAQTGEIQKVEQEIVERVFALGDKTVSSIMTPQKNLIMINVNDSFDTVRNAISKDFHTIYPVFENVRDNILGVVRLKEIFGISQQQNFNLRSFIRPVQYFRETTYAYEALDKFKSTKIDYGLVKNETGGILGIVTMDDILKHLV